MVSVCNEYGKLKKILLSRPKYLNVKKPINVIAEKNKKKGLNSDKVLKEFDIFVEAFKSYGVEVLMGQNHPHLVNSLCTRDLGVCSKKGIIFGRYVKTLRWSEHRLVENVLYENDISVFYKVVKGTFEGGDFMYVDEKNALVGMGCRTNMTGIKELEVALSDIDINLIPVDFDDDYLHLDMICNVIGDKVAVVCPEALPGHVLKLLKEKKFELIKVGKKDVFLHACNLLSIGNDTIFSHPQANEVNKKLKALGFNVEILELKEILKCGGGPRCNCFPVDREK